jgi:hypothetical protein
MAAMPDAHALAYVAKGQHAMVAALRTTVILAF